MSNRPVIALAAGGVGDLAELQASFGDRAVIRFIDMSSPEIIKTSTKGCDAVLVALHPMSAEYIDALDPSVKIIGRTGVGYNNVDVARARERGIEVYYEPNYGEAEVATHALSLLLALMRRLIPGDRNVRDGWNSPWQEYPDLCPEETAVGVIGAGRIGRKMIRLLQPVVGEIIAYDPVPSDLDVPVTWVDDLPSLLQRSQAITVHALLDESTQGMIGQKELKLLPPGGLVVNVARGGIVDEDALVDLLESGHLGGAGFDVFATEPLPTSSRLLTAPNTILTPHSAAASKRTAWRLSHWTTEDAISWLETGSLVHGSLIPSRATTGKGQ